MSDTAVIDARAGFDRAPERIEGPSAWLGSELARESADWLIEPDTAEWAELDTAIHAWEATGRPMSEISKSSFALPRLGARIGELAQQLLRGRGFFMLRGFDVNRYSIEQAAIGYLGIGAHIGAFRSQNARGHLLGHVRDLGRDIDDPGTRYYQTHRALEFHTDSCDVVGLLCLRGARSGGESRIVSSVSLYNRMRATAPELCRALFEPFPTDRRGRGSGGNGAVVRDTGFQLV